MEKITKDTTKIPQLYDPLYFDQKLRKECLTPKEIAKELNCSMTSVYRSKAKFKIKQYKPHQDKMWLEDVYQIQRVPISEIARHCGCNPRLIYYWLEKLGISRNRNYPEVRAPASV